MPGPRVIALVALLAGTAGGCGTDQPVTGSVDLPLITATGLDVVGFTGRVSRGSSVRVTLAGGGRGTTVVESSGRFSAAIGGLEPGVNVVRVRATKRGRTAWRERLQVVRRPESSQVRVPREDVTPPVAMLRVQGRGGAPATLTVSPSDDEDTHPTVRLTAPELRATAIVRDDGGAGRVRLSTTYRVRCGTRVRPVHVSLPPAQIENVRLTPGSFVATEETRTATLPLAAGPGCTAAGQVWAEGTDGQGLQAVSRHVAFTYAPAS